MREVSLRRQRAHRVAGELEQSALFEGLPRRHRRAGRKGVGGVRRDRQRRQRQLAAVETRCDGAGARSKPHHLPVCSGSKDGGRLGRPRQRCHAPARSVHQSTFRPQALQHRAALDRTAWKYPCQCGQLHAPAIPPLTHSECSEPPQEHCTSPQLRRLLRLLCLHHRSLRS